MEALRDPKTWMLIVYSLKSNIPNGGYTSPNIPSYVSNYSSTKFTSIVLQSLGFSTLKTYLIAMPLSAFILIVVLSTSFAASKLKNSRCYLMAFTTIIAIIGSALVYSTTKTAPRYAGLCLMGTFSAGIPLQLALVSSNTGGFTKRATVSALLFVSYCVGNIIGPQIFFSWQAGNFKAGSLKRDTEALELSHTQAEIETEFPDFTDWENRHFRYKY
ncbi:uncharacterized protein N7496_006893 [Penicillium cataractarum]|uniref:Major facilitator superfamily (MFS) profile domain-containing protein n=1 Tax=Penicillium cataractarum TaxID=2100454 RepID=A0A9W9S2H4_9EURO|nr:uncharacterized protein N7496_006893 [Penicillium cataractarum]KAJ5370801.1 hypothetical protein N7496_006893 [Penicillium cataractarum]